MQIEDPVSMWRLGLCAAALLGFLGFGYSEASSSPRIPAGEPVAIVVHKQNALTEISLKDLRGFFMMEKRTWPAGAGPVSGKDVVLFLRSSDSAEQKTALEKIYGMSADQLERHWVEFIYQGKISSAPVAKNSAAQVLRAVSREPAAISFLLLKDVTADVKILKVDGESPESEKYPLVAAR